MLQVFYIDIAEVDLMLHMLQHSHLRAREAGERCSWEAQGAVGKQESRRRKQESVRERRGRSLPVCTVGSRVDVQQAPQGSGLVRPSDTSV